MIRKLYNVHTIWIVMLGLTLTTYAVGRYGFNGATAVSFLLLTAVAKSIFIIREFMGLRGVSLLWQLIMYGWLLIVILAIGISYLISLSAP